MRMEMVIEQKPWVLEAVPGQEEVAHLMGEVPALHPSVAALLVQRGITDRQKLRPFVNASLENLHDPYLYKGMERAVAALQEAIVSQWPVMVMGDYDVDGTTAVALFSQLLEHFTPHVHVYIPDRYTEGYGVSPEAVAHAAAIGCKLFVSLDCGTSNVVEVAQARALGMEFIICDHHLAGPVLPDATAILNARQLDCPYPFKELSGCGVGFKLMQAYLMRHAESQYGLLEQYLDVMAVSICADLVRLEDENRTLAKLGLEKINTKPSPGLEALINSAGLGRGADGNYTIDCQRVIFSLAPRINSAGRMEHGKFAVDLLKAQDAGKAWELAQRLDKHNTTRRETDFDVARQALEMIEQDPFLKASWGTVLYHEDWNRGVVGITASRVVDQYYRPTVVLTRVENDMAAGSARSVHGFDLYGALQQCSHLLEQFGGHKYAAGLSLPIAQIEAFRHKFDEVVRAQMPPLKRHQQVGAHLEVTFGQVLEGDEGRRFWTHLQQVAPFGVGNPIPLFVTRGLRLCLDSKILNHRLTGEPAHLALKVEDPLTGHRREAVGWRMAHKMPELRAAQRIDIAYTLEEHRYGERPPYLRLVLVDVKAGE